MKKGYFKFVPYGLPADAVAKEARPGEKAGNELIDENNYAENIRENKILQYLSKYFPKIKSRKKYKSLEKVVGFKVD